MHFVNGQPAQHISITDRGLLYGQSLFETIAVVNQRALLIDLHLTRLGRGCTALDIPFDSQLVADEINSICKAINDDGVSKPGQKQSFNVLRVAITMGEGGRGYLNPSQAEATRIVSIYDYPEHPGGNWQQGIVLGQSDIKLALQPVLAGIKHSNRLEQTLIRAGWQADWQEALVTDQNDSVIEATQSNIFAVRSNTIITPDLSNCGVEGVMRETILETAQKLGINSKVMPLSLADVEAADELFVSNSLIGLWPVRLFKSAELKGGKPQEYRYNDFTISHKLLKELQQNGSIPTF